LLMSGQVTAVVWEAAAAEMPPAMMREIMDSHLARLSSALSTPECDQVAACLPPKFPSE